LILMGLSIHNWQRELELAELRVVRDSANPLGERNAQLILKFSHHLSARSLSAGRIARYVQELRKLGELLGKPFDEATRADIEDLVAKLERLPLSARTKRDHKAALKLFYRWLRGADEYPEEVRWIKTTLKLKDFLLPEDLLTEEDVKKLVEAASNPRDKAFIMTLYESGARIGELGSLRIRDVRFEEGYAALMLRGKTGARRVIVVASVPYLANWLQNHPLRRDPDSPLWVSRDGKLVGYAGLAKLLRMTAKRAGLQKKVNPHKLRHSRATFLAGKLTEAQMNQLFGWRQGSVMPSIYVHLSGRDVDEAILGLYGLRKPEEEKPKLAPRACPRCQTSNPFDASFCSRCGLALDVKVAMRLEEEARKEDEELAKVLEDPEVRALLIRKLEELRR